MSREETLALAVSNGFYQNDEGTITSPFIEDVDISELLLDFADDIREACAKKVETIETYEKIEKACFKFAAKTIRTQGDTK